MGADLLNRPPYCVGGVQSPAHLFLLSPLGGGKWQGRGLAAWPGTDRGPPRAVGIGARSLEMPLPAKAAESPCSTRD